MTVLYYLLPGRAWRWRNWLLFLASVGFYWCGEPRLVLLMLASILVNWTLGLWAGAARRKGRGVRTVVTAAAAVNVGLLFVFKYLSFLTRELHGIFPKIGTVDIALPIGISFFTFQAMSYVFDVARGQVEPERDLLTVGLYIAFFPQLIAGPIIKYSTFAAQSGRRQCPVEMVSSGTQRFAVGFCKKVLLANNLALLADAAFGSKAPGATLAILGAVCYTLQIYYDFSGYSDMAIGLAKLFGFRFPENFTHPYVSRSVTEFWRRWHISLSGWFRDYVYIPLGGNRGGLKKQIRNLFVVWLLTGIWHGANWTFLLWGLFYFLLLTLEKTTGLDKRAPKALGHLYTMAAVILAWVIFRAEDLGAAVRYIGAIFGANGFFDTRTLFWLKEELVFLLAGIVLCVPLGERLRKRVTGRRASAVLETAGQLALFALFVVSVTYIIKGTYNPFIYFNF